MHIALFFLSCSFFGAMGVSDDTHGDDDGQTGWQYTMGSLHIDWPKIILFRGKLLDSTYREIESFVTNDGYRPLGRLPF